MSHLYTYKDFVRCTVRIEHLLVSWHTVLDVGLRLDDNEYEEFDPLDFAYASELFPCFSCLQAFRTNRAVMNPC
jgi:hypothetical protein